MGVQPLFRVARCATQSSAVRRASSRLSPCMYPRVVFSCAASLCLDSLQTRARLADFPQRRPEELGAFHWIVDAKEQMDRPTGRNDGRLPSGQVCSPDRFAHPSVSFTRVTILISIDFLPLIPSICGSISLTPAGGAWTQGSTSILFLGRASDFHPCTNQGSSLLIS